MDPQQAQIYLSHDPIFAPVERKAAAGLDGSNYRALQSAIWAIVAPHYPGIASSKVELAVRGSLGAAAQTFPTWELGFGGNSIKE